MRNENLELARLRWQCRRGMLELDELLGRFLENHYLTASPTEQALFKELLTHNDQDLFTWLMGHQPPTDARFVALIQRIRTNA